MGRADIRPLTDAETLAAAGEVEVENLVVQADDGALPGADVPAAAHAVRRRSREPVAVGSTA